MTSNENESRHKRMRKYGEISFRPLCHTSKSLRSHARRSNGCLRVTRKGRLRSHTNYAQTSLTWPVQHRRGRAVECFESIRYILSSGCQGRVSRLKRSCWGLRIACFVAPTKHWQRERNAFVCLAPIIVSAYSLKLAAGLRL